MQRMPASQTKAVKVTFIFGAEPPALSIVTEDGESLWFEMENDNEILALIENASMHINKKFRLMYMRERNGG